jgi:cobalt-zinc-cadmium efflux system protein
MAHSHGAHEYAHRANDHQHAHGHGPSSDLAPGTFTDREARQARRLATVLAIVGGFFVLEVGGAIAANSVVLQADALHLLMDLLALGVSLFAMRLAVRRPTPRFTYGLRRAEPVAAIFSALLVLATTVGIVFEGVEALGARTPPKAGVMLVVAVMALAVNGLSAWLLHDAIEHRHETDEAAPHPPKAHGHALNLRGAWLHLLGDTLGAVAALCAALVIRFGGHPAADPIASFVVAAILLYGSLRLLRDATLVLLEAAPLHLPVALIRQLVADFPGVVAVHDLHVWSLGAGHDAVTVHVRTDSSEPAFGQHLADRIRTGLGVEYVTVQVDAHDDPSGDP